MLASGANDDASKLYEQAYRAYLSAGDQLGAVRAATALVRTHESATNWAAARAWEQRGWRLLDQLGPNVERGYHELAWLGCDVHDPEQLLAHAERALAIGLDFGDLQLTLRAQSDRALALVSLGRVEEGLALADEVMVGITAGDVPDAVTRSFSYCALMTSCERSGDRGRADVIAEAIEADGLPPTVTHCELVRASVDAMRGQWDRADARFNEIRGRVPSRWVQIIASARLAELRIQQGRYEDAADLLQGYEDEFEAAPAVAALHIARGEYQKAAGALRTYTLGLGGDCLRLAPALAQLVDLDLLRGDRSAAARAAQQLRELVETGCDSIEARALADSVGARMAGVAGDHDAAISGLEQALGRVINRERPLLAAQIRLELGRAFLEAGERESAAVEVEAALSSFQRLGVEPQISAARALLAELQAPGANDTASGVPAEGRRLASVLFTDIVGSTEQLARRGDREWKAVLDEHDRAVHRVVGEHRGRVVNHTGDGILATFDGPNSAIQAALALQLALAEHGIQIRTGIHAGEVEQRGANIGGIAVHMAARVMAKAEADEVLVSGTVRELVAGSDLRFADRGEFELKGIPGSWRLWRVER